MAENYFKKFPRISYANNAAVNITERAVMLNSVIKNPYIFYPYTISQEERPDHISDRYYNDQFMDWIIYLSNKIVDPYYGWYLDDDNLTQVIMKKYNTSDTNYLTQKVVFYRSNSYKEDQIDVSEFNALPAETKKYWIPSYGAYGNPIYYIRDPQDIQINTNMMVSYEADGTNFVRDEVVKIVFDPNNVGKGQVCFSNSSVITLQHMSGTTLSNNSVLISGSSYLYGRESFSNVAFTSTTLVSQNISELEVPYWEPVDIMTYEMEINELNRDIRILDNSFSIQTANELKRLLK